MCVSAKPWWWKPLWIYLLLSTIALGAVNYLLFHIPLERVAGGLALTFLMIGFAYYIRIRPSRRVNRVLYISLGACITFLAVLFGNASVFLVTGLPPIPTYLGPWLSFIVVMIASPIAGAFIGDRIGKRRNYRLPLSLGDEPTRPRERSTEEVR